MGKNAGISKYLSYVLRHGAQELELDMDIHGWVLVEQLLIKINERKNYQLDRNRLEKIVAEDNKGRYRFSEDGLKIKACQGHSIPWIVPQLEYQEPPQYLYHGTTTEALEKIKESGGLSKMNRHAVHMQEDIEKAWQSAMRWKKKPLVLKIASKTYFESGGIFGKTENDVWCTEAVPLTFIIEEIYTR